MNKNEVINKLKRHDKDCGSTEVQICSLTSRINQINEHLRQNPHDHAGRRGCMVLIGKRRRLLKYLQRKSFVRYKETIAAAELRK
jgi:small subunit ribosomal protein S15